MALQLGVSPIAWSNDDLPELGGETPLETCLQEAREAGYSGVELGNKFPRQAAKLKVVLDAHNLRCVSGWYGSRLMEQSLDDELITLTPHLELLAAMGSTVVVFADVSGSVCGDRSKSLSSRPTLSPTQWDEFGSKLQKVSAYCQSYKLRLAYHEHMGTVVESRADISELLDRTDATVGLTFDTGHLAFAGVDPIDAIDSWGARIFHVHCKDVRADARKRAAHDDSSFLDAVLQGVFTVPGDGTIDFGSVGEALARCDYRQGWVVVEAEQDPAKANPLEYAKRGRDQLINALTDAGLAIDSAK